MLYGLIKIFIKSYDRLKFDGWILFTTSYLFLFSTHHVFFLFQEWDEQYWDELAGIKDGD
jgi:hypothetical protein